MPYMYVYKIDQHYHERGNSPFAKCGRDLRESTEERKLNGETKDPKIEEFCPICFKQFIEHIKKFSCIVQ